MLYLITALIVLAGIIAYCIYKMNKLFKDMPENPFDNYENY